MARANATKLTSHAETIWGAHGPSRPQSRHAYVAPAWLNKPSFLTALIGFVCLLTFVGLLSTSVHEKIVEDAAADFAIIAKSIVHDLRESLASRSTPKDAEHILQTLPETAFARGRRVIVTNDKDQIAFSAPAISAHVSTLADYLRPDVSLIGPPDKSGVVRVALADGSESLALIHRLPAPFGNVAVIGPLESSLLAWRPIAWRIALALTATAAPLLLFVALYIQQAQRRLNVETVNLRIRRRLETALSRGRCGLWDWDLSTNCIYWSDSMYELLGMRRTGRCLTVCEVEALINPQDGRLTGLADLAALSKCKSVDHEFRVKNARGEWIWLRARAELIEEAGRRHLVGIAVDVSEQRALAEHTATANLRLRDAIETISEAFVLWDARNQLVACNSKFLDLHGLTPDLTSPGAPYSEIMAHATAPLIQTEIAPSEHCPAKGRTYEVRLVDGRWLQINERRTKDGGYVSVGADITLLKWNEEKLIESERRLTMSVADLTKSRQKLEMQAQQLATLAEQYHHQKAEAEAAYLAKSIFLANMNHELRTPLNAVLGFSEMMLEETYGALGSPKYLEYCRDIHRSGSYLKEVLSDIIDMSELEAGRVRLAERELRVVDLVSSLAERWRGRAEEKGVSLSFDISPELRLSGDRDALAKALGMFLSNSVKFTASGGQVRVAARKAGEWINIFVEDSGCGIEKGAISKLGRPFEQPFALMENGMKGSGLGLAIARSLVELHRGKMRIRSRPGVGSIVLMRIPAVEAPAAPRSRASEALSVRIANRQTFPRSTRSAGSEITTRNPGALSSMRSAP
jgi:two-component system cell cycle sensor histidine kinase PleC